MICPFCDGRGWLDRPTTGIALIPCMGCRGGTVEYRQGACTKIAAPRSAGASRKAKRKLEPRS